MARKTKKKDVLGFQNNFTSISEIENLYEKEKLYHLIAELSRDFIYIIDSDMRVKYVNSFGARHLGQTPQQVAGKSLFSIFPKEVAKVRKQSIMKVFKSGQHYFVENSMLIGGKHLWLDTDLIPIKDGSGKVIYVLGISRDFTDRKNMEDEIRRTADEWKITFDSIKDHITVYDAGYRILRTNSAYSKWIGKSSEELIGRVCYQVIHDKKKRCKDCIVRDAFAGKKAVVEDEYWPERDVYLEVTAIPVLDEKKNVKSVIRITKDITERKKAEEAIKQERDLLSKINETTSALITLIDSDGKFIHMNKAGLEVTGHSLEKIKGKYIWETVHDPKTTNTVKKFVMNLISGKLPATVTYDNNFVRDDGVEKTVIWTSNVLRDSGGKIKYIIGTGIDVSERRQAEETIQQERDLLSTIIETTSAVVVLLDPEGRIIHMNKAGLETTGNSLELIKGNHAWNLLYDKKEIPKIRKLFKSVTQGAFPFTYEYKFVRDDGKEKTIIWTTTVLKNKDGSIKYIIATGIDVTEKRFAEEEIKQSYEKLKQIINSSIFAMAKIVEIKDLYTAGHHKNVSNLVYAICREMGFSEEKADAMKMSGILHDIGKIYIPAEILSKPGKLTDIEYNIVKAHPKVGYDILSMIELPYPVCDVVLQHHERLDGSGYPSGLSGEQILPESRILAVADVVDAMVFHRPYRPGWGVEKALEEIENNKGKIYDKRAVDACVKIFREKKFSF